jgi:GNAT superfamily N-acetyltransferase
LHQPAHPDVRLPGLAVSRLGERDLPALAELCAECSAFFEMVAGDCDPRREAEDILASLPPERTSREKHLFGFWRGTELVGAMDLGESYPGLHAWYVALFLLAPAIRQRGVGASLWAATESWIRMRGGTGVGLIVQRDNPRGRGFWETRGFTVTGETVQHVGDRVNQVWSMSRALVP